MASLSSLVSSLVSSASATVLVVQRSVCSAAAACSLASEASSVDSRANLKPVSVISDGGCQPISYQLHQSCVRAPMLRANSCLANGC
jgi:hypothetical protein